jgi:hypothetical protein
LRKFGVAAVVLFASCAERQPPTSPSDTNPIVASPSGPNCTYSVGGSTSRDAAAGGGVLLIPVATSSACAWTASSAADFLSVGPSNLTLGNGEAIVQVAANPGTERFGTIVVAGQSVTLRQHASPASSGCTFTVSPMRQVARARGEVISLAVATSGTPCAWTATTSDSFLKVLGPPSGDQSASVSIEVAPNGGRERVGTVAVAGKIVTIPQDAATDCVTSLTASPTQFTASGGNGTLTIDAPDICDWSVTVSGADFVSMSTRTGSGKAQLGFAAAANVTDQARTSTVSAGGKSVQLNQAASTNPTPTPPPTTPPPTPPPTPTLPYSGTQASSLFAFTSEAGDYIGQGRSRRDTAPSTRIEGTVDSSGRTATISVNSSDGTWWHLDFHAPQGRSLSPGTYEGATRAPFQAASAPGLSVFGDGRGCNTLTGRFIVHEISLTSGRLVRFHASFEQHCEGGARGLFGEVAVVQAPVSLPAPTPNPTTSRLAFVSDQGDYIGAGQSWSYTLATATFQVDNWGADYTRIIVTSRTNPGLSWSLRIGGAGGARLTPGLYENAARFSSSGVAGFDLSGDGRGCNAIWATFAVQQVTYSLSGYIDRLQATFEQHCEGGVPAARGEIIVIGNPPQ